MQKTSNSETDIYMLLIFATVKLVLQHCKRDGWDRRRETNEIRSGDASLFWHKHDIPYFKVDHHFRTNNWNTCKRQWNRIVFMQAPNAIKDVCVTKLVCSPIRVGLRFIWNIVIIILNENWPTQRCKSSMISINYISLKGGNVDQQRRS